MGSRVPWSLVDFEPIGSFNNLNGSKQSYICFRASIFFVDLTSQALEHTCIVTMRISIGLECQLYLDVYVLTSM